MEFFIVTETCSGVVVVAKLKKSSRAQLCKLKGLRLSPRKDGGENIAKSPAKVNLSNNETQFPRDQTHFGTKQKWKRRLLPTSKIHQHSVTRLREMSSWKKGFLINYNEILHIPSLHFDISWQKEQKTWFFQVILDF